MYPAATVASSPGLAYPTVIEWFLLSVDLILACITALYSVLDTWHTPPPYPGTIVAPTYVFASLYPLSGVVGPIVLL